MMETASPANSAEIGRAVIAPKELMLVLVGRTMSTGLNSNSRFACIMRFAGIYARGAIGGSGHACEWLPARCIASAIRIQDLLPHASITAPTPHASHRTSVRCPMKGLS